MQTSTIENCLLGTAVGDAVGLPYEGLSAERAAKLIGYPDRFHFCLGKGMVSDDTEHACLVAQSLIASATDEVMFERELAKRMRRWFLTGPAGLGRATLRACLKLCAGFGARRSGVFSAGNGPAMRAAIIGAAVDNADTALRLNRISARITHTDPKAEHGAAVVLLAAWGAARQQFATAHEFFRLVDAKLDGEHALDVLTAIRDVECSLADSESTLDFASKLCGARGVTGYILHTVPVCIHGWLSHRGNAAEMVRTLILCGGDADTTAAIAGGIIGCESAIDADLVAGIRDTPCSPRWMTRLSKQLARVSETGIPETPLQTSFLMQGTRNLLFLAVVLKHGFRRLLPPY
ncbi:ADP-ribosylglycohydrolase family protein [Fuerstiella marisgermanici]|uniref:ADP-ribosyl-[dinitrogen reductase] hydrolase n=1 Tax=Fuerstiella marisgermanici TaxID=1891926 RepID=A0A1P8WG80_9PLAN|nr:ADP-ribosylglycohydrolase family protein [Fuerstiella marisgermanici]APZ93050.1 ADP-ribosyl-[dinitrogen reductase] hydrolase [Fuerstiella marisgermanici]